MLQNPALNKGVKDILCENILGVFQDCSSTIEKEDQFHLVLSDVVVELTGCFSAVG